MKKIPYLKGGLKGWQHRTVFVNLSGDNTVPTYLYVLVVADYQEPGVRSLRRNHLWHRYHSSTRSDNIVADRCAP